MKQPNRAHYERDLLLEALKKALPIVQDAERDCSRHNGGLSRCVENELFVIEKALGKVQDK